jgi:hypothetical protein
MKKLIEEYSRQPLNDYQNIASDTEKRRSRLVIGQR